MVLLAGVPTIADGHGQDSYSAPFEGSMELASRLLHRHPYLLEPTQRQALILQLETAENEMKLELAEKPFIQLLESVRDTLSVDMNSEADLSPSTIRFFELPGDRGGILFKITQGPGPISFTCMEADLSKDEKMLTLPVASSGITWSLLSLDKAPDGATQLYLAITAETGASNTVPLQVTAPELGRLHFEILSDDTGNPTPAMVRLQWLLDGSDRRPGSAVDLTAQFDSQGSNRGGPIGSRPMRLPGLAPGNYWIVPGQVDMMVPPGDWKLTILRGIEHLVVEDNIPIRSGETTHRTYRPQRWVRMADRGWYSGDDHVHAQILSEADVDRLVAWARAEDTHVLNILEMGDHERTYFQQRAFGRAGRIQRGDILLVPGQEDPRIFNLGHTIAMNISQAVRDTSKYYLHDWFYDRVHALGGLYGYAHVNRKMFNIHRDLSLNIPKGKVDFVELLQFHNMGTELYYEFLNLGVKITASAGSDVPWGGSVGEVRVYAYTGDQELSADSWFEAFEAGRTFVTNGPMLEFYVDDALPGDEIELTTSPATVSVRARSWGHPDRLTPTRLEIVRHGEVIRSVEPSSPSDTALVLDFVLDPGPGCWLAARTYADDGSSAHTTPIYLSRPPLRFWDHENIPAIIDRCREQLDEVRNMAQVASDFDAITFEEGNGSLVGVWYGESDFTQPRGLDFFDYSEQGWPSSGGRGNFWSVRWKGTLKLPENLPHSLTFHLDSSGPSTLSIGGEMLLAKEGSGTMTKTVELISGKEHEIAVTYSNPGTRRRYLNLTWSAEGFDEQPIPSQWLAYRKEDHREAMRFSIRYDQQQIQLKEQAEALLERVKEARQLYQNLLQDWKAEAKIRK